jgi:hypothetical protein
MPQIATVAEQIDAQPTNKVAAAGTAAGAIGAVLVAVTSFVGPALEETLGSHMGPSSLQLVIAAVGALIGYFGLKYGSQAAAFNVLDAPNRPLTSHEPGSMT